MAQSQLMIDELKRALRAQGLTYARIAAALSLSESSVKRMFARRAFSLERFEQICALAGLEVSDLVELLSERRAYVTELSPEQERALLAEPKLLLLTYLLINGWTLDAITAEFEIDAGEIERMLIRLHRARLIELKPMNRFRLLTARNFTWRKDGPVQQFFQNQVQREFLDSRFAAPDEHLRFVGGTLTSASLRQLQHSIDRLALEFDELSRRDSALPLSERRGCSAVLAIRPWEFSMFAQWRRKP